MFPHFKTFNECIIGQVDIVVRFAVLGKAPKHQESNDVEIEMQQMNIPRDQHVMWKTFLVGRISLRADYGNTISTTILVENGIPTELLESITRSIQKKLYNQLRLDVTKAIFVFDVELNETSDSFRYTYAEWYNTSSLRNLKTAHFGQSPVPDRFCETCFKDVSCILCHQSMYVDLT